MKELAATSVEDRVALCPSLETGSGRRTERERPFSHVEGESLGEGAEGECYLLPVVPRIAETSLYLLQRPQQQYKQ